MTEITSLNALAEAIAKTTASQRVALGISCTHPPRPMAHVAELPTPEALQRDGYRIVRAADSAARYTAPARPDTQKEIDAAVRKALAKERAKIEREAQSKVSARVRELEEQLHGAQVELGRLRTILSGRGGR